MDKKEDTLLSSWGRSDQKLIRVKGTDYTELYIHLESNKWVIEHISACACDDVSTYCYVVLQRN